MLLAAGAFWGGVRSRRTVFSQAIVAVNDPTPVTPSPLSTNFLEQPRKKKSIRTRSRVPRATHTRIPTEVDHGQSGQGGGGGGDLCD